MSRFARDSEPAMSAEKGGTNVRVRALFGPRCGPVGGARGDERGRTPAGMASGDDVTAPTGLLAPAGVIAPGILLVHPCQQT